MKRLTCITALLLAGLGPAQAQDYFAGASLLAPGDAHLNIGGQRVKGHNDPLRFKLYGGMHLTDNMALEGGFVHFGKDRFAAPGADIGVSTDTLYLAARGTMRFGPSFELFGRVGVAAHRYRMSNLPGAGGSESGFSPMLGVGAGYKLTERITLTLEAENLGRIRVANRSRFGRGGYSAGLKYSF